MDLPIIMCIQKIKDQGMKHVKKSSQTILVLNCGSHAAATLNMKQRILGFPTMRFGFLEAR